MASKPVIIQSPTPLVYNDSIDTTNMTNVLLIDSTIIDNRELYDSANANTFPIIYSYSSKTADLLALLRQKFSASSIQRIALIFHDRGGNYAVPFMNNKSLFDDSDLIENQTSFTENVSFLIECIKEFNVANIDFLACNTLRYSNWKSYYSLLVAHTSVVVGASNDATGNVQYGGDWVMESTGQDIKQTYFTDSIDYYKYLLDTYTLNSIVYTYTIGTPTASATGFVTGITSANISSTIDISGNIYNVTSIGSNAFQNCTTLSSVTIPNSVTSIGDGAFFNASLLTSVIVPNSVTNIGADAFRNCIPLNSITLPTNPLFTSIGDRTFYFCVFLPSIIIPNSVTSIGEDAFSQCGSLTSVIIPDSVASIGDSAFEGCNFLASVTLPTNPLFERIGTRAFFFDVSLNSIIIPNSVTSIGDSAFFNCTSLGSVTLPTNPLFTAIENNAFEQCKSLTSVSIPSSVTSIGDSAFQSCVLLNLVYFLQTSSIPTIGSDAFASIKSPSVGKYYSGVANLSRIAPPVFTSISPITSETYTLNSIVYTYTIGTPTASATGFVTGITSANISSTIDISGNIYNVTSIGSNAFQNCTTLSSVTIPNSVTSIGGSAFQNCILLTSISIPNSVTTIGGSAFSGCTSLASVTLPTNPLFTTIDIGSFYNCILLASITIPNSVTTIGFVAFSNSTSLTSVSISNFVTSIGLGSFQGCTALTAVVVGSSNPNYSSDAYDVLFNKDQTTLIYYPTGNTRTTYNIPSSVTSIETYAFSLCTSLISISIPNFVATIGIQAFSNCTSLASVSIPNSVVTIGSQAFFVCTSLDSVTIGNSVTSIQYNTFTNCTSLASVTIGNSVATIESQAFSGCTSLASVSIPSSVTSIGVSAFQDCTLLSSVSIPSSVTSIGDSAFQSCVLLNLVYFLQTSSIPTIGSDAFASIKSPSVGKYYSGVANLSRIAPPVFTSISPITSETYTLNSIVYTYTIGTPTASATGFVTGITSANISSTIDISGNIYNVTSIGSNAFNDCTTLNSVTIPNSVTTIEIGAFQGCLSLTSVTIIGNSVTTIGAAAFGNCPILTSVAIPNSVTTIGIQAFASCSALTSVNIPNSVTTIENLAFQSCSALTAFVVDALNPNYSNDADGVLFNKLKTTLIQYPIGNTRTTYTIPNSVEIIEIAAFFVCTSLTSVDIPNSVTTIEYAAFQACSALTSVDIPNSVETIGNVAFLNCTSLTSVTIGDSVTTIGTTIGDAAFQSCSVLNSVSIGNSVESIGANAFLNCTSLTSLSIGDSVATIGDSAFRNCISLTSITIPDSVTNIGDSAFRDCLNLTSIILPTNALFITIGNFMFQDCSKLASVTIPDSVTTIENLAFAYCTLLASVTISDSVASIGDSAFVNCHALTSVTIPNSVSSIGFSAFQSCTELNLVYFLQTSSIPTIESGAFTAIRTPSVGKYYSGVANLSRIEPPVFTSISPIGDVIQTPNPLVTETPLGGQVLYTDPNYEVIPDISSNTTYTLRTNVSDPTKDVFTDSTSLPQAFIPNSLFINYITNPMGIARDSVGNFYVADGGEIGSPSSTINVYPPSGINPFRFITLDSSGSGLPGQTWVNLRWLAFDSSDNLYVTNEPDISVDPSGNGIAFVAAGASTNTYSKTIFPPSPDYTYTLNCGRGIIYYNNYLYIPIRQNTLINPPYLIKYNIISGAYLTLNLSEYLPDGGFPIMVARNPLYLSSPTPFLYLASHPTENKILSISEISGSETTSGGTGTANIGLLYAFSTTQIHIHTT